MSLAWDQTHVDMQWRCNAGMQAHYCANTAHTTTNYHQAVCMQYKT